MSGPARNRAEIARAAAASIEAFERTDAASTRVVVGFDGFIDSVIHVVSRRDSMLTDDFERIRTIPEFAARVGGASGKSANLELVVREQRFGGNGPLMAGALGRLGTSVTYVGAVGQSAEPSRLHPVYMPFAKRCAAVVPISPPGATDALEFEDGKLMLGKPQNLQRITWDFVSETLGADRLVSMFGGASLIGVVNWVMQAGVEGIWRGLIDDVLGKLDPARRPRIFIDLCDPAKRSDTDIGRALGLIGELNRAAPVTLGLNLAESQRIAQVAEARPFDDSHNLSMGVAVRQTADSIREKLGLDTVVVHPREGAAASRDGGVFWFEGPFTSSPRLSTGAGDHFNGGFAFAQLAGLGLDECLAVGTGVSGAYVRDAQSPTIERLVGFLRDLPGVG